VSMN